MLEPVGEQIRIDAIRTLRHDLHMRPFEASRRVYLVFGADLMNEDAADALLKDLEEPPGYAVIVLVADELGPLPETIRSRCQLVPFQRLSRRALLTFVSERRPELSPEALAAVVRVAGGRLDRAARLLDEEAIAQRDALLELARTPYAAERFDAGEAAGVVLGFAKASADRAREAAAGAGRRGDRARARAARAPGRPWGGARGDRRGAGSARQLVPRRRRSGGRSQGRLRSTPTGSISSIWTAGRSGPQLPPPPRRPSPRPGGASSCRSSRRLRWRRSSSSSARLSARIVWQGRPR